MPEFVFTKWIYIVTSVPFFVSLREFLKTSILFIFKRLKGRGYIVFITSKISISKTCTKLLTLLRIKH